MGYFRDLWRHRRSQGSRPGKILKASNLVKNFILKLYFFILVKISYYRALNTPKRLNGGILGSYDVIVGPRGLGRQKILKASNLVKIFILKMYFILMKISNCRVLNTQKLQSGGMLGVYDVIGGPRGLNREKFRKRHILSKILFWKCTLFWTKSPIIGL